MMLAAPARRRSSQYLFDVATHTRLQSFQKSFICHRYQIAKDDLLIYRGQRRHNHNKNIQPTKRSPKSNHHQSNNNNNEKKQQRQIKNHNETKNKVYSLFASTLPGLERILSHELESKICIKKNNQSITKGGISFEVSSIKDLYRCHLLLGTASHLYLRANVGSKKDEDVGNNESQRPRENSHSKTTFYAIHEKQLVQKVRNMDIWKELIPAVNPKDVPIIDIRVSATKSKLHHTKMIADLVRRGIHNSLDFGNNHNLALNDAFNKCFNDDGPKIRVLVRIQHDEVEISIDTSQIPLYRRGYKLDVRKAPLREDIAYGLLYTMGWGDSYNDDDKSGSVSKCLIDPFCGSGTILIEGASMALGLPPGRLRTTPCQYTSLYDEGLWNKVIQHEMSIAKQKYDESNPNHYPLIVGGDRDEGAIEATIANAKRAGVDEVIEVEGSAIKANKWMNPQTVMSAMDPTQPSQVFVATNPPFGLRISSTKGKGKQNNLLPLYQSFGNEVKKLNAVTTKSDTSLNVGLIAHDIELARKTGIVDLKSLFTTQLGGIPIVALSDSSTAKI